MEVRWIENLETDDSNESVKYLIVLFSTKTGNNNDEDDDDNINNNNNNDIEYTGSGNLLKRDLRQKFPILFQLTNTPNSATPNSATPNSAKPCQIHISTQQRLSLNPTKSDDPFHKAYKRAARDEFFENLTWLEIRHSSKSQLTVSRPFNSNLNAQTPESLNPGYQPSCKNGRKRRPTIIDAAPSNTKLRGLFITSNEYLDAVSRDALETQSEFSDNDGIAIWADFGYKKLMSDFSSCGPEEIYGVDASQVANIFEVYDCYVNGDLMAAPILNDRSVNGKVTSWKKKDLFEDSLEMEDSSSDDNDYGDDSSSDEFNLDLDTKENYEKELTD